MLLNIGEPLIGRLLLYDALDMSVEFVKLKKNPKCRVCGPNSDIKELIDYEEFCGVPGHDRESSSTVGVLDISATELAQRLKSNAIVLLDVREPHGWEEGVRLSKDMGLYRQKYCGCIFSEEERFFKNK